jgi:5-methylcytosine-specific restriction endonuclease McrA
LSKPEYTPERAAYFAALYQERKKDPEFLARMAEKARLRRAADPGIARRSNLQRKAKDPDAERARVREWFAKNPEKRRAYENNRRAKAKAAGGKVSADIAQRLMTLQRGKCACCRSDLTKVAFHLDHVIPLTGGGRNDDSNMQLLCARCNNQKYNKHPVDFMQSKGYLL